MILVAIGFVAFVAAAADGPFRTLFNGRDLDGWLQDTLGVWSVRDGMIVGRSPGLKHNDFLRTTKTYRDFVLRVRFRLIDGRGNAGIQFRTAEIPGSHEVSGYQADIGEKYWGCLYDESRRKKVLVEAAPEALEGLRKDDWNQYVITARGKEITLELNGKRTVRYVETAPGIPDSGIPDSGIIALQVHSGPPMEIWNAGLEIQELNP